MLRKRQKIQLLIYFSIIMLFLFSLLACEREEKGLIISFDFLDVEQVDLNINEELLTIISYVKNGTTIGTFKPDIKVSSSYVLYDENDNEYIKGESEYDFSEPVKFVVVKSDQSQEPWVWTVIVKEQDADDLWDLEDFGLVDNDMWWADTRWRRNSVPMRVGLKDLTTEEITWFGPHFPNNENWNNLDDYGTRIRWGWFGGQIDLKTQSNASVITEWKFIVEPARAYPQLYTGFELTNPPSEEDEQDGLLFTVRINGDLWYENHLYSDDPPNLWLNLIDFRGEEVIMSWEVAPGPNGMNNLSGMNFWEPWFSFSNPSHMNYRNPEKGRDSEPVIVPWDPR